MAKVRKDTKGRVLHRGESYNKNKQLYCFSYTDPLGTRRYVYSQDLGRLREKEEEITRDRIDHIDIYTKSKADINFVFDRYISNRCDLRSTTMTHYLYTYDRYVRKGFGKKRIADIRYSDVLIYYRALLDRGLTISTVEAVHGLLHPTFQMAVRDSVIRCNPSDGVVAELKKKDKGKSGLRHALTYEEECSFLEYIESDDYIRWKPLFVVLFGTGCRIGEVIGLRWSDINFNDNYIEINHSITYFPRHDKNYKCEFRISLPKTDSGIRQIPMLDKVREVLLQEKEYQEKTGIRCITEIDGMKGFIFFNRYGFVHKPSSLNKEIHRIVINYNAAEEVRASREGRRPRLVPDFSCHITRHTFCSRSHQKGCRQKELFWKYKFELFHHKAIQSA